MTVYETPCLHDGTVLEIQQWMKIRILIIIFLFTDFYSLKHFLRVITRVILNDLVKEENKKQSKNVK